MQRGLRRAPVPPGPTRPRRVLVISASMGAGHDGAARELAARLRAEGHEAEVRDFLSSGPLRIGAALRWGYEFELRHIPSAYDASYRLWYRVPWLCPLVAWLVALLTRRRLQKWIRAGKVDVVVSTYPLSTLSLGRLRSQGRVRVPAVNFITDFGVHPLWVHKGMDLNLAVHAGPAEVAKRRTGKPAIASGPVVSPRFGPGTPAERAAAREVIGLRPEDRAVLVVAGSWGVGGLDETFTAVAASGRHVPVVVCGRDARLREHVQSLAAAGGARRAVVLGWTDDMPALMQACDALVENAGGLTSLEALRSGLPVVSFRPIAGHGRENTSAMAAAGVSRLAADPAELTAALDVLCAPGPERDEQIAAGQAMFKEDAASLIVAVAGGPLDRWPTHHRRRMATRTATGLVATAALAWGGLTTGVGVAAAAGLGVAHPGPDPGAVAFVGVRLDVQELGDPTVTSALELLGASAVVDQRSAAQAPAAVAALARAGVDIESAGSGARRTPSGALSRPALWNRARSDTTSGRRLAALTGEPVRVFVPSRRLNVFDLVDCSHAHDIVVVPNKVLKVADPDASTALAALAAHKIYEIDGIGADPTQLVTFLAQTRDGLAARRLHAAPLSALR
ncbi:MAG: MGDG synthase family glycosyltransferase [Acidimicrobiales bacterium]